tara:strand:+ start:171 stop:818 length:648 start_codon:yes stop_codon:yes gene_type:complete
MKKVISLPVFLILFTLLISSCSTSKNGSAFQKRRYTKGWHVNIKSPFKKQVKNANQPEQELATLPPAETPNILAENTTPEIREKKQLPKLESKSSYPSEKAKQQTKKKAFTLNHFMEGIGFDRIFPSNKASTNNRASAEISNSQKLTLFGMSMAGGSGFAVAGFICSLVGLFVPFLAVLGVIFSAIGLNSSRHGLALAGLIIGIVALVVPFLIWF